MIRDDHGDQGASKGVSSDELWAALAGGAVAGEVRGIGAQPLTVR